MSEQPLLYLPNGLKPSGDWDAKSTPKPRRVPKMPSRQKLQNLAHTGREMGKPAGVYMDDLSSQHAAIWLCFKCRSKFDNKTAHYFYEKNLRVRGACDGCKTFDVEAHLFIHESTLTDPGGKSRHGCVWTPR